MEIMRCLYNNISSKIANNMLTLVEKNHVNAVFKTKNNYIRVGILQLVKHYLNDIILSFAKLSSILKSGQARMISHFSM
jgi:hypothetical protein